MFLSFRNLRAAVVAGVLGLLVMGPAHAITINMTYFNEGDPIPHDENPTWDPAGTILKAHFQAAKAIWESLLPGGGTYDFDFEWDNDIGGLGQYTPGADFIEINPDFDWYADPTPNDSVEFNLTNAQTLYAGLSPGNQSTYFPGTAPPGSLEVGFRGTGFANSMFSNTLSLSNQLLPGTMTPVDASNGYDLLSTVVHEMGHALGINGVEPGDYNIYPQHVGGLEDVTVLEGDGGHLAGQGAVPFLMCENCGTPGVRRFASATDVLVVAEDQGITIVQLARVGRISSGLWSDTNAWIGGDVPDVTQDVYITHDGTVTLDTDAQARDLKIIPSNTVQVLNHNLNAKGMLTLMGGTISVDSGGSISANTIGHEGTLTTAAGSFVRFNDFVNGPASVSFNGSVAVGYSITPADSTVFNPNVITSWNISQNLIIGDQNNATVVVDNGTWTVNGDVTLGKVIDTFLNGGWTGGIALQNDGVMTIGGNLDLQLGAVTVEDTAALNVAGNITIGKLSGITYRDNRSATSRPHFVAGGETVFVGGTPPTISVSGGSVTFEDTANAADATFTVEGGKAANGPGGLVVFKGNSFAGNSTPTDPPTDPPPPRAEFRTKGGRLSGAAGNGGQVRFEGTSRANNAILINEGAAEHSTGTGGRTVFVQNSTAERAVIHNHGPAYINGDAGATLFYNYSTAESATITNHADGNRNLFPQNYTRTVFFDSSDAGNATIENEGAPYNPGGSISPGLTEFRGNSSAGLSNIYNRAYLTTSGLGAGLAGRTMFYDSATAADATIHTYEGASDHGRVEFRNQSKAGRARIIMENVPAATSNGGYVNFFDNSSAEQSQIFVRAGVCCFGGISFNHNATAADAQILKEDGASTFNITFQGNSTAGDPASAPTAATALFTLGRGSVMGFYDQTKAEDAGINMSHGSILQFQNNSSAGAAQVAAAGSSVFGIEGAAITFNTSSLVNNATITLGGGMASQATGAKVLFNNGSHAGNSTITANGGTNGGGGATITFSNSYGDSAQIIAIVGSTVDFVIQPTFNNGTTTLGSIEGAGSYILRGSHLIAGSLNFSTTVSGPIKDNPNANPTYSGGRLTKVGTGTLTLAGTNAYSGLTTVDGGTVSVTGSITGGAVVNSGGTINGTGTIGGTVAVNAGGVFAPGLSPGTITVRGLTMNAGSTLNFEIGDPARDHIMLTNSGNVSLGGSLNVSLLSGYTPVLGQTFPLFEGAVGSVTGAFASYVPPQVGNVMVDLRQIAGALVLQVVGATIPGDFNDDGKVDARDYVVWRKGLGNPYTQTHYNTWRANFGQLGGGSGVDSTGTVPEPATWALAVLAAIAAFARRSHR